MGAPHAVDFGRNNQNSPDGKLYMVSTGAERPESHESWMQGDSVYLSRTTRAADAPDFASTINTGAAWEFYSPAGWTPSLADAAPLLVWPNRTGVVTLSWHATLSKYILVIGTPTAGCSMVGTFDAYVIATPPSASPYSGAFINAR